MEGGEQAESDSSRSIPALANEEQFAAVDDVGDCAGREANQEDGQARGGLHEGHEDGKGVRMVISQVAPTFCIHAPRLEAIEAIQSQRNMVTPRGPH